MDFELSEEQRALQDSLTRLLSDRYGHEQRRAAMNSEAGYSEDLWAQLAELGVTALPIPETYGGIGGNAVDLLPVMQAFGHALLSVPVLTSSVLVSTALQYSADEATKLKWLPALAAGETQLAWAHDEPGSDSPDRWIATRATRDTVGWTLSGTKISVLYAGSASHYLVTARIAGANDDDEGRALFLLAADAPGLTLRRYRLIDDTPAGELRLLDAPAVPVSAKPGESTGTAIDAALAAGIAASCADMVGSMEAALGLTIEYLNTRRQFGRLIGENQALRHRVAEMVVSLELARSMSIGAAVAATDPARSDSALDLHRAKLLIGRHARSLCQAAIQLHGGIGMTHEYAVGHYLRRVHVQDQLFGDSDAHARRLVELS